MPMLSGQSSDAERFCVASMKSDTEMGESGILKAQPRYSSVEKRKRTD